jgi:hypothetical protein
VTPKPLGLDGGDTAAGAIAGLLAREASADFVPSTTVAGRREDPEPERLAQSGVELALPIREHADR